MMLSSVVLLVVLGRVASSFPFFHPTEAAGYLTPKSMAEMVLPNGYPMEEHEVETADGYILSMYRIPYGRNSTWGPRPPVLLMHGILCSSACWVLSEPEKGLGFVLADAGFDVWMGNNRGNTYSMKHKFLSPTKDKKQFWDFSFHEMGYYDLPAMVDAILERTGASSVQYVGHSQGTTQFFSMLATRPEYQPKLRSMSALAPIAFLDQTKGAVNILTKFTGVLGWIANHLGIYNILSDNFFLRLMDQAICRKTAITRPMCDNLLFLIAGYDSQQLNTSLVPVIAEHCPAGSSLKQLLHFGQLASNGRKFCQYDYGKAENLKRYNSETPPNYDLSHVTVPILLHYGANDWLASVVDVDFLADQFPKGIATKVEVPFAYFNHLDFMWAIDVRPLLYDKVITLMKNYLEH